ncbi:MAG: hypothetical protein AB8G15_17245 [Saprospiraceae bacterium]
MNRLALLLGFLFLAATSNTLFAQTASTSTAISASDLLETNDESWSIYADEENKTFYIDFESIKVNLSDIIVKNTSGEVVLKEDVMDLPVDTIFELDFSDYTAGEYFIELRSFTSVIKKNVLIK